jgi:S1-C subfamily serine protease
VFSLAGIFIGIVSEAGASATVIPAESLKAAADSEQTAAELRGDFAVEVQPLSPALAKVAGTDQGVMISYVHPQGPSAGALESGDVITSVDGSTVTTPEAFLDLTRSRTPGSAVRIHGVRRGKPLDVGIIARDAAGAPRAPAAADAGMTLRVADGLGAELIAVRPDGAAASAGLAAGDIVVRLDGRDAPVVSDILRAYRALAPGRALLLTVQRGSGHQVVALEKR